MAALPLAFTEQTRRLMGDERFERYLRAFDEEPPVSIRLNPRKTEVSGERLEVRDGEPVPWCRGAYYLRQRPNFTFDPLLHAGCYYVQEAASMFLDHVLSEELRVKSEEFATARDDRKANARNNREATGAVANSSLFTLHSSLTALDMCAAPGGKSTLLRSALPAECVLYSNEPVRQRASILAENVQKWGYENHIVTNCYPRDYRASKLSFDVILCDVPCSGEGMFRKDPATIREWSPQNVDKCAALQRDIVSDAWACLRPGGLLIYSTCTFNTKENEENIRWMLSEFDAEAVSVSTQPEWNITGSLLEGFTEPVYRFIPGISRGEGLFMCVLRKSRAATGNNSRAAAPLPSRGGARGGVCNIPTGLKILTPPLTPPLHGRGAAAHEDIPQTKTCNAQVDVDYKTAISYLRGEALVLPADTPRSEVTVTFLGHPLGPVKNIGTRANNLYPKPWRIKTTHIPNDYEAILRHT